MLQLLINNQAALIFCTSLLGLLIGSFLNVLIYRFPKMMEQSWLQQAKEVLHLPQDENAIRFDLISPASHCPHCAKPIKPQHNIPLFSWLYLRGKSACCGQRISKKYPVIEALTVVLSAACAWNFGWGMPLVGALIVTWTLIAAAVIDKDTQLLPDELTLGLLWAGLFFAYCGWGIAGLELKDAVAGAMLGYLCLWTIYWGFKLVTGKEGMGYGDFKLLAALCAWMGWKALLKIILLSSLSAIVVGVFLMLQKKNAQRSAHAIWPLSCDGRVAGDDVYGV